MNDILSAIYKSGLFNPVNIMRLICAMQRSGRNLHALLRYSAGRFPLRTAMVCDGHTLTYADLLKLSNEKTEQIRQQANIQPGTCVAICLGNKMEMVALLFAIARCDAHIFLVGPHLAPGQAEDLLQRANIEYYFTTHTLPPRTINTSGTPANKRAGNISVLSSGTGGAIKASTRAAKAAGFLLPYAYISQQLQLHLYSSIYIAVPLSHGYGFAALCMAVALGKQIMISEHFDAQRAATLVSRHNIESMAVVPTQLQRMLPLLAGSGLECIISGGAALPPQLATRTLQAGYRLFNLYGTSEAGVAMLATPGQLRQHPGTIGHPIKGARINIVLRPGDSNGSGGIHIKSPWTVSAADWIDTGDIGYRNEQGYYFVCGRADKMIVSGGENVYPETVQQVALQHPGIQQAAAIGIADTEYGQSILLYAVAGHGITTEQLREWLRQRVARHELPRHIIFVDEIPHTHTGKPIVNLLTDLYPTNTTEPYAPIS